MARWHAPSPRLPRVAVDGKFFRVGEDRFPFHGVTYGTFAPREPDGARFPERPQLERDLAAMCRAGFTVVRTYTPPPDDLLEAAATAGMKVLAGVFYADWRYLVGASRRQVHRVAADARAEVESVTRRLAGNEHVLGLSLGNEVPADVLRWCGTERIAGVLGDLAREAHDIDAAQLVTYGNYPTAEYLPLDELDFLMFNVFLEQPAAFRRYLTRLQHLAGDRPLVLGEVGLDANGPVGEEGQAEALDWQLETAVERGVAGTCVFSWTDEWWVGDSAVDGWSFGLTRADRSPRPALDVARRWNAMRVADLQAEWPTISVVICAYNAEATLDECLRHTCALEYPGLEIVVVDDGSTDATASITIRHPSARLVSVPHAGLSVARNAGCDAATGSIVAYLDSDAYPSPEWPYYLALGFDDANVGGVGGPNVPPRDDAPGTEQVARAPGGPLHVLLSDDRAEHVPGCNMAFWRETILDVGGFDPVYTSAGDDVDFCWRLIDDGWEIGFHPAALVWHHRRPGLRPYLRQQRGYGRSEALVEARHPDRFTGFGSARWKGHIYDSFPVPLLRQRVYRGVYGTASYQSVYRGGGYGLDLAHQVGVPVALVALATAPLGLLSRWFALPALLALVFLVALAVIDIARADPPRGFCGSRARFRTGVAVMHLLQPVVRTWGRTRNRALARRDLPPPARIAGPVTTLPHGALLVPDTAPRAETSAAIVTGLRRAGLRVLPPTGWEDYDARIVASVFLYGDLVTSAHPIGSVQIRVRRRVRWANLALAAAVAAGLVVVNVWIAAAVTAAVAIGLGIAVRRTGSRVRRAVVATAS